MQSKKTVVISLILIMAIVAVACSQNPVEPEEIGRFPVDDMEGLITRSGVEIDKVITSDEISCRRDTSGSIEPMRGER